MKIKICTIGFTGKSAQQFFALLHGAGVKTVVDVRENRVGQLSGFAKYPDIEFFLKTVGNILYQHAPDLAPTSAIRKMYRDTKNWDAYRSAFVQLIRKRRAIAAVKPFTKPAALLCSEPGPEKCHRGLLADMLAEQWRAKGHTVEIQHLVAK